MEYIDSLDYWQETYPDNSYQYGDYGPLLRAFGHIVIQVDQDDYQGDSWLLYEKRGGDHTYGYLHFGWGSCSGCDALQGCNNYEELAELGKQLRNDVKWLPTSEMIEHLQAEERESDPSGYEKDARAFRAAAIAYLQFKNNP